MGFTWRKSSRSHKQKAKFPCSSASQVSISIPFGYIHWPKQHHGKAYGQAPQSDLGLKVRRPEHGSVCIKINFGNSYYLSSTMYD